MKKYNKHRISCSILAAFILTLLTGSIFGQNMFRKITDFDGDGKTDYAITRNENGYKYWYVWQSTNGYRVFQWGLASDQNAAGDYDGDGKTDFAVMRLTADGGQTNQTFYIYSSLTNSYYEQTNTITGSGLAVGAFPQDFDGDGKTDLASSFSNAFSQSIVWTESSTNQIKSFSPSGANFIPRIGDLTGDGKSDLVSVDLSTYNVTIRDYATGNTQTLRFGKSGDIYVPTDFDNDGKGDLTVWRESEGNWWTMRSSDNTVSVARWGASGDIPVPGDYDGDGITDPAVWRRTSSQSQYWVYGSSSGAYLFPFGISSDTLVRY